MVDAPVLKIKNKSKTMTDVIMGYGSPSSQIKMIKKVLNLLVYTDTYKLIYSRSLELKSSKQYSPTLSNLNIFTSYLISNKVNT